MKTAIIFCCALGVVASWRFRRNDDVPSYFVDTVKEKGYPVESYDVKTEDGYILKMFRIPHGKDDSSSTSSETGRHFNTIERIDSTSSETGRHFNTIERTDSTSSETGRHFNTIERTDSTSSETGRHLNTIERTDSSSSEMKKDSSSSSSSSEETNKKVVFLMHGLMTNAECFIQGDSSESLAFYLADAGFDVFLGNARGTIYGQRHTTLDPEKDAAFWKYCWDEIGAKDLPVMIEKALKVSGQDKLKFIGHNEGTTSFYAMASENSDMRDKIERHISLCPVVFLKNSDNEILDTVKEHLKEKSWIMKNMGSSRFTPSDDLTHDAEEDCMNSMNDDKICKNTFFLMNGFNAKHFDEDMIDQFTSRVPSTVSTREILHMAQMKKSGRFEKYSEDMDGEEYDLSNMKIPVAVLYPQNDNLCTTQDVDTLAKKLPNVFKKTMMDDMDNNLELLFSDDMKGVMAKVEKVLKDDIGYGRRSK